MVLAEKKARWRFKKLHFEGVRPGWLLPGYATVLKYVFEKERKKNVNNLKPEEFL